MKNRRFSMCSPISVGTVIDRFGSWNDAIKAAGLVPIDRVDVAREANERAKIPDDELLHDLLRLAEDSKSCPTIAQISSRGQFSPSVYRRRFVSHSKAFEEAKKRFPEWTNDRNSAKQCRDVKTNILSCNHKVVQNPSSASRTIFGERIDFRGLTYAPINESGVVFFFGMVAKELGFLIESIRQEYPDCEGKRCISKDRTKWAHVRIEFEYKSSNFRAHGHDPRGCDLVVCWVHDWHDCPIEILELKSAISALSPSV